LTKSISHHLALFAMRHDDWQDAALTHRHIHNRVNRSGGKSKQGVFDAKKAFGSYKLDCKSYLKHVGKEDTSLQPSLELYRFTDDQQGLVGHISFPKCFEGTVLLAGSRKVLNKIISGLSEELVRSEEDEAAPSPVDDDQEVSRASEDDAEGAEEHDDDEDEEDDEEEQEEEEEASRISTFEKNSFRSPKFWLRWQADVASSSAPDKETVQETNSGYLVFAGNDCRKFTGTISCEGLGWNNASVTGWKLKGRSEQDCAIEWKQEETT
jgi:cobalamin biosynthesis protein CobT